MTQQSVFHLEPFARFLHRVVELNRLHSPEGPLHEALSLEHDAWHEFVDQAGPDADDAIKARKELAEIHEQFPAGAPVHQQAAYLVRAFNAARPFTEANHRTGWDYTAELLEHNGFSMLATVGESRELGSQLWERLEGDTHDVAAKDAVYEFLEEWFKPRLAKSG